LFFSRSVFSRKVEDPRGTSVSELEDLYAYLSGG